MGDNLQSHALVCVGDFWNKWCYLLLLPNEAMYFFKKSGATYFFGALWGVLQGILKKYQSKVTHGQVLKCKLRDTWICKVHHCNYVATLRTKDKTGLIKVSGSANQKSIMDHLVISCSSLIQLFERSCQMGLPVV